MAVQTKTIGWEPGCAHGHDPIPATVLDCFSGAGTTWLVSHKHRRQYIGIEINPDYCKMSVERVGKETKQLKLF